MYAFRLENKDRGSWLRVVEGIEKRSLLLMMQATDLTVSDSDRLEAVTRLDELRLLLHSQAEALDIDRGRERAAADLVAIRGVY